MKREFTLVELLVVIAIIAILAAILLPTLNTVKDKAREKSAGADINLLEVAAENYKLDFRRYPEDDNTNVGITFESSYEFFDNKNDSDSNAETLWNGKDGAESNAALVHYLTTKTGGGYLEVKRSRIPQAGSLTVDDDGDWQYQDDLRVFLDPWDQPYMYNLGNDGWDPAADVNGDGKIDIVSIGSDGKDGDGDGDEYDGGAFSETESGDYKDNINNWED